MTKSTGIMEVTLIAARGLKNTELFGKMDPYVVLEYKKDEQQSSTGKHKKRNIISRLQCCVCMQGQGNNPVWNEKFKFDVEYDSGVEHEQHLILKLMDRDTFTNDDYLGQATIYVEELIEQGVNEGKAELRAQKYRVVLSNQTYRGEIEVGITFVLNSDATQHENGGLSKSES